MGMEETMSLLTLPKETLESALAKAALEFAVPKKDRKGQYRQSKFDYASLKSVVDAVRGPLARHGVSMVQLLGSADNGDTTLELVVFGHGDRLSTRMVFAHPSIAQEFGSLVTYMRRYQLQAFFVLEGDSDTDDTGEPIQARPNGISAAKPKEAVQAEVTIRATTAVPVDELRMAAQGLGVKAWRDLCERNGLPVLIKDFNETQRALALGAIKGETKQ